MRIEKTVSKNRLRVLLSVAATLLVSVGFATFAAAPAQASTLPHCTTSDIVYDYPRQFRVPSLASGSAGCQLSYGDSGEGVRALQWILNKCNGASLSIDKQFGPATKSALQAAQRAGGVAADGIYGHDTRGAIKFAKYFNNGVFAECSRW